MATSGSKSKRVGTAVKVAAVVVIAVALLAAARSPRPAPNSSSAGSVSRSTAQPVRSATTTPAASSNIPGGPLATCTGGVISNETVSSGTNTVNLTVYADGGRTCAVATKIADTSRRKGQLVLTLQFADAIGTTWPELAEQRTAPTAVRTGGVYLDKTNDRCVRAEAHFTPTSGGQAVTVSTTRSGCG